MGPTLAGLAIGFLVLGVVLWPLERRFPALPHQPLVRQGFTTDLAYWVFTPLVTRVIARGGVIVAVVLLAAAAGVPLDRTHVEAFLARPGALAGRQPMALQVVEVLLLGFSPGILAGYVPFLTLYAIVLHANVTWSFGPLRYVLASPTFHRRHHTSEEEGLDRNFAGLFPVFDLVFGIFHMPPGRRPQRFGLARETVPEGLLAQLAYPFRAQARGRERLTGSSATSQSAVP